MKKLPILILILVLTVLLGGQTGCSKKTKSDGITTGSPIGGDSSMTDDTSSTTSQTDGGQEMTTTSPIAIEFGDVFYDFDEHILRDDAREVLSHNARVLVSAPGVKILIEGHCDERGTREYNMALGDKRARAAKEFLVNYGVNASRIELISYGEENPFASGHNDVAWAQNRRAHFVIQ